MLPMPFISPMSLPRIDRLQAIGLATAAALHVVLLALAWQHSDRESVPAMATLSVRLLPAQVVAEPTPTPPKPVPVKPVPREPLPAPVRRVVQPAPAAAPPPPEPVAPPVEVPPAPAVTEAAPVAAPVVAPRFDAAYLNNPAPVYPLASRRLNEAGRVLLRVQVSAQGQALQVLLHQSSGFARLDQAAQTAVQRWRFVPARQGEVAVSEWVIVPITFSLTR